MEAITKEKFIELFLKSKSFKENRTYETFFSQISREYRICIWGAGLCGRSVYNWLTDNQVEVSCFCDNNKQLENKEIVGNCLCISVSELRNHIDEYYVIVAVGNLWQSKEINNQLAEFKHIFRNPLGITTYWQQTFEIEAEEAWKQFEKSRKIFDDKYSCDLYEFLFLLRFQHEVIDYPIDYMEKWYSPNQYIATDLLDYSKITSVVDCGAYTGDSLHDFINVCDKSTKYYCYEMDKKIYELLLTNIAKYYQGDSNVYVKNVGVGKEESVAFYVENEFGGSRISNEPTVQSILIQPLDLLMGDNVTDFIKMDIEGAEEDALYGASRIIDRDKPVLAISIYHNLLQFLKMPQIIRELCKDYKLYLKHHKCTADDTVIYAIIDKNVHKRL
ncbi:MAG: FkbM family methyltransferase [Lachnospiraceae bacterium]|nr:FkbM family methyltransferase [Lachnospiraceae bacterium]